MSIRLSQLFFSLSLSLFPSLGLMRRHHFASTHDQRGRTRAPVSGAAALLLLLYLPGGNHCGGSSEPARVASSWGLTPPTQSYPPPLLGFGPPPLLPGWNLVFEEAPRMLDPRMGFASPRAAAAAASRRCPGAPTDPPRSQM